MISKVDPMYAKYAFVCTTPFQLMNMVNYICAKGIQKPDLYIRIETDEMKRYAENAKRLDLFNSVHEFVFYGLSQTNRIKKAICRGVEYFLPQKGLQNCLVNAKDSARGYEIIVTGSPDTFTLMLYAINPNALIYYIDDGTGSYHGNIGSNLMTNKGRVLQAILGRGPEKVHPSKLILYKPELSTNVYHAELEKLYPVQEDNSLANTILHQLFSRTTGHEEKGSAMIYLAQPAPVDSDTAAYAKIRETELKCLSDNFGDAVLLRPHPRERAIGSFELSVDTSEYPWELSCLTRVFDTTILIGSFSSALMTPKLLYDTEPFIVFTVKTYEDCLNPKTYAEVLELIQSFKETYHNKQKIFLAKSIDETVEIIQKINDK